MVEGFHVADGLYFRRLDDGSVQITKKRNAVPSSDIIFQYVIDPDSWASVVASVTPKGEDGATYRMAENLHAFGRLEPPTAI